MNGNMVPFLVIFGLIIWLVVSEASFEPIKPKLISTKKTTTKRTYD